MAKLRKFEIDAVVDTIMDKVKEKNSLLKITENDLTDAMEKKYPELVELNLIEKKIGILTKEKTNLVADIKKKYATNESRYTYNIIPNLKNQIKEELKEKLGFTVIDRKKIENRIILESSSTDLKSITETLIKEFKL